VLAVYKQTGRLHNAKLSHVVVKAPELGSCGVIIFFTVVIVLRKLQALTPRKFIAGKRKFVPFARNEDLNRKA
jgi:hypothetical protein